MEPGTDFSDLGPAGERVLAADGLSELFGLEMGTTDEGQTPNVVRAAARPIQAGRSSAPSRKVTRKRTPAAKVRAKTRAKKRKRPKR